VTEGGIRLSAADPKVEPWPAGHGTYIVTFRLEGEKPFDVLHDPIKSRAEEAGFQIVRVEYDSVSLSGVQEGREAEAQKAVEDGIAEVTERRRERREQIERERPVREAEKRQKAEALERVREAFRKLGRPD
jgi:regulator of protease activity HflC (stomatin/prohibitin superfamily)